jgi:hypothetical protein
MRQARSPWRLRSSAWGQEPQPKRAPHQRQLLLSLPARPTCMDARHRPCASRSEVSMGADVACALCLVLPLLAPGGRAVVWHSHIADSPARPWRM